MSIATDVASTVMPSCPHGDGSVPMPLATGGSSLATDLAAYADQRLGTDIQALTLVTEQTGESAEPRVWEVMTAYGYFWLVEDGHALELFRAGRSHARGRKSDRCPSPTQAIARFRGLHAACPAPTVPRA